MPFFMVDDQFATNRKPQDLIELEGPTQGGVAIGLWTLAGSHSQSKGTDGIVTGGDLTRLLLDRRAALKAAKLLVKHGLWHEHGHDCPKCTPVPDGSFVFHDWWALGYDSAAKVRQNRAKKAELKDPEIVEAVWARDGENCRYCGRGVRRKDTRSENRPTIDHVIPGIARGVGNLVVCCWPCNRAKMQRTPEQAGMTLLPPPNPRVDDPDDPTTTNRPGPADHSGPPPGLGRGPDVVPGVPHRTGTGTGDGSGTGPGTGRGTGDAQGAPPDTPPPRPPRPDLTDHGTAGPAPDPGTPARYGSPWADHTGPPVHDYPPESWCDVHSDHQPCRHCRADATRPPPGARPTTRPSPRSSRKRKR